MSQDGNNHLFNNSNFQTTTSPFDPASLYHPDMNTTTMQFAASVPHRPNQQQQQHHLPMNFPPFPTNQEVMAPHPQFSLGYPGSPYERPDSSSNASAKQTQTKAERRAEHNATERARRESLNVKFQQLAFSLPNLQNDSRPSKGTIIDRTLDFVKGAIIKEERMQYRINELEKFSRYLLSELDKKNSSSSSNAKEEEEEDLVTTTTSPLNQTTSPIVAPGSVASEDSLVEEMNNNTTNHINKIHIPTKRNNNNNINNRRSRPVSRTSVSMIPKLDYNNTAWPTTTSTPLKPQQLPNYQQQLVEQQHFLDQQHLMKEHTMQQQSNIFQHSFQPSTTTTTSMLFQQQQQQQQKFLGDNTTDTFIMNSPTDQFNSTNNNTFMLNNSFHLMEQQLQHRR